jgi:hypothetical protein
VEVDPPDAFEAPPEVEPPEAFEPPALLDVPAAFEPPDALEPPVDAPVPPSALVCPPLPFAELPPFVVPGSETSPEHALSVPPETTSEPTMTPS